MKCFAGWASQLHLGVGAQHGPRGVDTGMAFRGPGTCIGFVNKICLDEVSLGRGSSPWCARLPTLGAWSTGGSDGSSELLQK